MKNFIQKGDVLSLTAPGAISSGDAIIVGALFGVAVHDAEVGSTVSVQVCGVFELPKAADDVNEGDALYWDAVAGNLTTDASDNMLVGAAVAASDVLAVTARVRLNG
ncbi:MAG: DUF2190 family protein [Pseudomonadota bacterium]